MAELVGIARLAAQSPTLESKRRVEYFELETRKYLTKCENMPFRWTINPYRGCEFGCKYCYARYAHEFMELRDPVDFERKIYVKHFDAIAFRQELERLPLGETIALGTATDPISPPSAAMSILGRYCKCLRTRPDCALGSLRNRI